MVLVKPVYAVDPKPEKIPEKSVVEQTPQMGEKKTEQHAPTIDVGDTRKFMKNSPLSRAKEDEWSYYY